MRLERESEQLNRPPLGVSLQVGSLHNTPPAGGLFHTAAVGADGKIRVFEVWDSREQAEAWGEKVLAARTDLGLGDGPPSIEYLDVHNIIQR